VSIEPMYELRSRGRLARRARRLALPLAALSLFGLHELYHFADWLSWGLGYDGLRNVATTLYPYFGQHGFLSYVVHVLVSAVVLAALVTYCLTSWRGDAGRSRAGKRGRATSWLLVEGEDIGVLGPWRIDPPPVHRNGSESSEEQRPGSESAARK